MKIGSDYTSNRAWLRDVVGNQPMILRSVSALEYLQLFVGYFQKQGGGLCLGGKFGRKYPMYT